MGKYYGGGWGSKLPASLLNEVLANIPVAPNSELLVGFGAADDGAVFRLRPDLAIIKTLDFFTPLVDDPYVFGQIAAANALSDVWAMGGAPVVALNILAYPADGDISYLEAMLKGGADKVAEAGCVLGGGHSIADTSVKYGLSVTGTAHPNKILQNNTCRIADKIILTKPLGVGITAAAYAANEADEVAFYEAVKHMTALNRYAMEIAKNYRINAATDVTGFGFLGHLHEMVKENSIVVESGEIALISGAYELAKDFMTTSGGQRNRESLGCNVQFHGISRAMEEVLFDPQTSGGLLLSVDKADADELLYKIQEKGIIASIVAEVTKKGATDINVY